MLLSALRGSHYDCRARHARKLRSFALYALQGFALLSLFGLALAVRQHRSPWPLVLGLPASSLWRGLCMARSLRACFMAACSACSPRPSGTVCCRVATGAARLSGQVPASRPVSPSCSRSSLVRSAADALPKSCPPMLACSFTTARHVTLVSSPNRAIAAFSAATARAVPAYPAGSDMLHVVASPDTTHRGRLLGSIFPPLTDAQNLPSGSGFRQYREQSTQQARRALGSGIQPEAPSLERGCGLLEGRFLVHDEHDEALAG